VLKRVLVFIFYSRLTPKREERQPKRGQRGKRPVKRPQRGAKEDPSKIKIETALPEVKKANFPLQATQE
jgi:hypothetical protein